VRVVEALRVLKEARACDIADHLGARPPSHRCPRPPWADRHRPRCRPAPP